MLDWTPQFWIGSNGGPEPIMVWQAYGSAPTASIVQDKQFMGEIQQMGFTSTLDASMGVG